MDFKATIIDRLTPGLRAYRAALPDVAHGAAEDTADEYAQWVRDRYLSGQALAVRTGRTRRSVQPVVVQRGVIGVRPGVGVPGGMTYLARFERGERPFMQPALRSFTASARPGELVQGVVATDLRRRGW